MLYQSTVDGQNMVDVLTSQNIVPGIKVDKGFVPLVGSNDESWCQGLEGLASRSAAYYQQGAHYSEWSICPCCERSGLGSCTLCFHFSVFVRRAIRSGGHTKPERDEPKPKPMARVNGSDPIRIVLIPYPYPYFFLDPVPSGSGYVSDIIQIRIWSGFCRIRIRIRIFFGY